MAKDDYFSEGKYRCNHPESDFEDNSKGPIEMKKENFVEYTHRNETANYRYDVWGSSDNVSRPSYLAPDYTKNRSQYSQNTNRSNYNNSYNNSSSKKKSNNLGCFIILLFWGLPFIFSILGAILEIIGELF